MTSPRAALEATIASKRLFRVARSLALTAVPTLADASSVDVVESLCHDCHDSARTPGQVAGGIRLRSAAYLRARGGEARHTYAVGEVRPVLPTPPSWQGLTRPRLICRLDQDSRWPARDTTRVWLLREAGVHSLIVLPLAVGGVILGVVGLYRRADSAPFDEDDLREAGRLADHAARCLDTVSRHPEERAPARPRNVPYRLRSFRRSAHSKQPTATSRQGSRPDSGSTSSRCPAPGWLWWWAQQKGEACTPRSE
jgi:hypothetical protein